MTNQGRDELETEFNARYDDIAERFSGEFRQCVICGMPTIDPYEHCDLP